MYIKNSSLKKQSKSFLKLNGNGEKDKDKDKDEDDDFFDENKHNHKKRHQIEKEIEELVEIEIITDDEVKYYVEPNEEFILVVNLYNPDNFEIQSFTLNGKKYANYMFEEGSDMENLYLKVVAPKTSGYTEYTIDAIKYIDGTEIKDVDLRGDKTIKAGIKYNAEPVATFDNLQITHNSLSFDVNVSDPNNIINENEVFVCISDGEEVIESKKLESLTEKVKFENLHADTLYQCGVITSYDLCDGNEVQEHVIYKESFTTVSIIDIEILPSYSFSHNTITFDYSSIDPDNTKIISIALYDSATKELVEELENLQIKKFENLLSDHSYFVLIEFTHNLNGEEVSYFAIAETKTLNALEPQVYINFIDATKDSISFDYEVIQYFDNCEIKTIELYTDNKLAYTLEDLTTKVFENVLSNRLYEIRITYIYDLLDGKGAFEKTVNRSIYVTAKDVPTISVTNIVSTHTDISFDLSFVDEDKILKIKEIGLYLNENLIESKELAEQLEFNDLYTDNEYELKITYEYDLNEGKGLEEVVYTEVIKTKALKAPELKIDELIVSDSTVQGQYKVINKENLKEIKSVAIYKEEELVFENEDLVIDFNQLDYYTLYNIVITYNYDLNDGKGVVEEKYSYEVTTNPYFNFTSCKIVNTSAVSIGEKVYIQANIENPLKATYTNVVVNGVMYNVSNTSTTSKLLMEIKLDDSFKGGNTVFEIEKVYAVLNGKEYEISVSTNNADEVFINGDLNIKDIYIVNKNFEKIDWCWLSEEVYVMFEFDNPTGYSIKSINDGTDRELIRINDNQWYYEYPKNLDSKFEINQVCYYNEYYEGTLDVSAKISYLRMESDEIHYVSKPEDLKNMESCYYYELTNSIDLSGIEWMGNDFNGVFNGNGYYIENMSLIKTFARGEQNLGLFEFAKGFIYDLHFSNILYLVEISSDANTEDIFYGSVAGKSVNLVLNNVTVDENSYISIKGNAREAYIGGLVGYEFTDYTQCDNSVLIDCHNNADIIGGNQVYGEYFIGGLVGRIATIETLLEGCSNSGEIKDGGFTGGLVGFAETLTIKNSYNTGYIYGAYGTGGFVGCVNSSANIIDSHNDGQISGNDSIGGLVGIGATLNIKNSYNTGYINGAYGTGGFVGYVTSSANIIDSHNDGQISGNEYIGGLVGSGATLNINDSFNKGNISGVSSVGGLVGQVVDLNIKNSYNTGDVVGEFVVAGLVASSNNTNIENCYNEGLISGTSSVAGVMVSTETLTAKNIYNKGEIIADSYASGVLNCLSGLSTIENSYNIGTVTGYSEVAGFINTIGGNANAQIVNCYNMANINSEMKAAGFIYYLIDCDVTIENCYNGGTIICQFKGGGIVGWNDSNTLTIKNSINAGVIEFVEKDHPEIAGIVGYGGVDRQVLEVINSYTIVKYNKYDVIINKDYLLDKAFYILILEWKEEEWDFDVLEEGVYPVHRENFDGEITEYEEPVISFATNCDQKIDSISTYLIKEDELPYLAVEGKYLMGWYDNPEFTGEMITNTYFTTTNITLYAKWLDWEGYLLNDCLIQTGQSTLSLQNCQDKILYINIKNVAFYVESTTGEKNVEKIVFGPDVAYINMNSLRLLENLKIIEFVSNTPPKINLVNEEGFAKKIYIPKGTYDAYANGGSFWEAMIEKEKLIERE